MGQTHVRREDTTPYKTECLALHFHNRKVLGSILGPNADVTGAFLDCGQHSRQRLR